MFMENSPNNPATTVTSAVLNAALKAEFGKFEVRLDKKLDKLLSDQANVILEAVDELVEKKLDDKFNPVITKLDAVLKEFEDHRDEDIAGAEQLRRHDDQLKKHETRIGKLESARV